MALRAAVAAVLLFAPAAFGQSPRVLDTFDDVSFWRGRASEAASLGIAPEGGALRMDVQLPNGHAYGIVRRAVSIPLPTDFEVRYSVRTTGPVRVSLRMLGPGGRSWMITSPHRPFLPLTWDTLHVSDYAFEFSPGPGPDRVAAIEFVVVADSGGAGTVWLDDLVLVPRAASGDAEITASSATDLQTAARAYDGDAATVWRSEGDVAEWLELDFGGPRPLGGLAITWGPSNHAVDYAIELSDDGDVWRIAYTASGSTGGRDWIYMPGNEARYLRLQMLRSARGSGYVVREIEVLRGEQVRTKDAFFRRIASDAPAGMYPRPLLSGAAYYTVAGAAGGEAEILVGEDGAVELGPAGPLLEPFLLIDGGLRDWADVRAEPRLVGGDLPIPEVRWLHADSLTLTVTVLVTGEPGATTLLVRYRVENRGAAPREPILFVALRPFALAAGRTGHVARIDEVGWDGVAVTINHARRVVPLVPPTSFGSATFMQGDIVDSLRTGQLPARPRAVDLFGHASAALAFAFEIPPAGARDAILAVPLHAASPVPEPGPGVTDAADAFVQSLSETATVWRERTGNVEITAPVQAAPMLRALRTSLAYLDIHADGVRLQAGSRSGERSRIDRDAPVARALLRLGRFEQVRNYIDAFAAAQSPDGRIPCCIDARGAWPGPGNESRGALLSLIADYHRHTADTAYVRQQWPVIQRAVAWLDAAWRAPAPAPDAVPLLDLDPGMPPPRTTTDDVETLHALEDAVHLAEVLGHTAERDRFMAVLEAFGDDVASRTARAKERHGVDHLPVSLEDGSPDVVTAATALSGEAARERLGESTLRATLEAGWQRIAARREDRTAWDAWSIHEMRAVPAFLRLGWTARVHDAIDLMLAHRRPRGWNQWPERITRDERAAAPGDMPYGGAAADWVAAVLDLFAFPRSEDDALVLGAGVPSAWLAEGGEVTVRGLSTRYGPLDYTIRAEGPRVHIDVAGNLRVPPGGIIVRSPLGTPVTRAVVDGVTVRTGENGEIRLDRAPAEVILYH